MIFQPGSGKLLSNFVILYRQKLVYDTFCQQFLVVFFGIVVFCTLLVDFYYFLVISNSFWYFFKIHFITFTFQCYKAKHEVSRIWHEFINIFIFFSRKTFRLPVNISESEKTSTYWLVKKFHKTIRLTCVLIVNLVYKTLQPCASILVSQPCNIQSQYWVTFERKNIFLFCP